MNQDSRVSLLQQNHLAAAHVAFVGLQLVFAVASRSCQTGSIVEYPAVAAVGCVPHRIIRPLGIVVDHVVRWEIGIAVHSGGKDYPAVQMEDFFLKIGGKMRSVRLVNVVVTCWGLLPGTIS